MPNLFRYPTRQVTKYAIADFYDGVLKKFQHDVFIIIPIYTYQISAYQPASINKLFVNNF
jgi:hypothetical protein